MMLSKEDTFCEAMDCSAAEKASANVLDFGKHGDDILNRLFWSVFINLIGNSASAADEDVTVKWETSDAEDFGTKATPYTVVLPAASVVKGAYVIKNAPLPKGLKRYNRLTFSETGGSAFPNVTAFVHDGRDEGTPFKGL